MKDEGGRLPFILVSGLSISPHMNSSVERKISENCNSRRRLTYLMIVERAVERVPNGARGLDTASATSSRERKYVIIIFEVL